MDEPYDYTQEDHAREVERVLMYIAQAHRKAEEIAAQLAKEGAERRFVDGLETAAAALLAEHNRLLNTTHFPVPEDPPAKPGAGSGDALAPSEDGEQQQLTGSSDQQRMAL